MLGLRCVCTQPAAGLWLVKLLIQYRYLVFDQRTQCIHTQGWGPGLSGLRPDIDTVLANHRPAAGCVCTQLAWQCPPGSPAAAPPQAVLQSVGSFIQSDTLCLFYRFILRTQSKSLFLSSSSSATARLDHFHQHHTTGLELLSQPYPYVVSFEKAKERVAESNGKQYAIYCHCHHGRLA